MTATDAPAIPRRRPQFHPLTVAKVESLTDHALAVTIDRDGGWYHGSDAP